MSRGTQDTNQPASSRVRGSHPVSPTFPDRSTSFHRSSVGPSTPANTLAGLGFSAFARHYSQNPFFSSGYLDVSVRPVPLPFGITPHHGCWVSPFGHLWLLAVAHTSPELFAVYHVLHRHLTPRHPPCALIRFSVCDTEKSMLVIPVPVFVC